VQSTPSKRGAGLVTAVLTAETFDAIAARLDVSRRNSSELWSIIVAAAPRYRPPPKGAEDPRAVASAKLKKTMTHLLPALTEDSLGDGACYIEDFLEQLHLWAGNPLALKVGSGDRSRGPVSQAWSLQQEVLQISAAARARLTALKAELEPGARCPEDQPETATEQAPLAMGAQAPTVDNSRSGVRRRSKPKLPWLAHFSSSRTPSPALL
jgi:hypothetical protein